MLPHLRPTDWQYISIHIIYIYIIIIILLVYIWPPREEALDGDKVCSGSVSSPGYKKTASAAGNTRLAVQLRKWLDQACCGQKQIAHQHPSEAAETYPACLGNCGCATERSLFKDEQLAHGALEGRGVLHAAPDAALVGCPQVL